MGHRFVGTLATCLCLVATFAPGRALAQAEDKTTANLARAREKYESEVNRVREDVTRVLNAALNSASKGTDPVEALKQAKAKQTAFRSTGTLPEDKAQARWKTDYAKAASDLMRAYVAASADYTTQHRDALAAAVDSELEQFTTQWDLAPWQDRLVKDAKPQQERTLDIDGKPLTIEMNLSGNYRADIRAKRMGERGTLVVEIPLADGKRVALPAIVDKGDIHVMLTVRGGLVSADLGVARPIDLALAQTSSGTELSLQSDGGPVEVESVRVKPIIDGKPAEVQEQAKKPERPSDKIKPAGESKLDTAALLPAKSRLGGTWTPDDRHSQHVSATVVRSDLNQLEIKVDVSGTGQLALVFDVKGESLSLRSIQPTGNSGGTYYEENGSGSIDSRNGTVSVQAICRWRLDVERSKGVKGNIKSAKMSLELNK